MTETGYSRYRQYYQRVEPLLKTRHVRAYTMAILSFFTLSFFGAFAIRPAIKEIFELNRKIEDRRVVTQSLNEKIKSLQLAEIEYKKIQSDLPLIFGALPQSSNFSPFLKTIEVSASSSAISLSNIKFQNVSILDSTENKPATESGGAAPLKNFSLDLTGSSGYSSLFAFLKLLERDQRLINMSDLSFTSDKFGTSSANLQLTLKGQTYYSPSNIKEEVSGEE